MSTSLQSKIEQLASEFANGVLEAVVSSPMEEILQASGGGKTSKVKFEAGTTTKQPKVKGARLARRSDEDIAAVVEQLVELLKNNPDGMRAEQIREELGLEAKELPRPIADALSSKQITKSGDKRATTYFAATKAKAKKAKKAAKKSKPAAKKAKPAKKAKKKAVKKATPAVSSEVVASE
jgi:hypothetical protein